MSLDVSGRSAQEYGSGEYRWADGQVVKVKQWPIRGQRLRIESGVGHAGVCGAARVEITHPPSQGSSGVQRRDLAPIRSGRADDRSPGRVW